MGYPEVKRIEIPRWGNFYFSRKYDEEKIENLLSEARMIYNSLIDIPILPKVFDQLEQDVVRRSIPGTAAIEGNPLSEERVGEILSNPSTVDKSNPTEIEIKNLDWAYDTIKEMTSEMNQPDEKLICSIHETILFGIDNLNYSQPYRTGRVKVGDKNHGGTYNPPYNLKDINNLMNEFLLFIHSYELVNLDPVIRAALAHFHFGLIHPFEDGNGRTARIVEAILIKLGNIIFFPTALSNYYYKHVDEYYWAFSLARKNKQRDITPFIEFVLKGVIEVLEEIKSNVTSYIRELALREFYIQLRQGREITQRQYDLLDMLLHEPRQFSFADLYNGKPFDMLYRGVTERTARRDLRKLLSKELLYRKENNIYTLNVEVLDLSYYQKKLT
ncbi:MAG: Fic family protein [Candidatus Latescibacteria bacterium]|nr:Fic family protein [Candidatus Latescibacterota bacterium]